MSGSTSVLSSSPLSSLQQTPPSGTPHFVASGSLSCCSRRTSCTAESEREGEADREEDDDDARWMGQSESLLAALFEPPSRAGRA